MASVIPGYNYDIFISYRQKDNKGDKWVSEFVDALRDELEATFKEEISVYFDINPHDGLLETHDVDESLKEKLKCLVFIPIISRTYCDPKSFAWGHEFKVFVDQASLDQFGLKVKLPGGNVASRVLPIRIYDLDAEDIDLCESVLGSVMRGIEFIHRASGVNRPLTSLDDQIRESGKVFYRDQINKVANAVKGIIIALKKPDQPDEKVVEVSITEKAVKRKYWNTKTIIGSFIVVLLIALGFIIIPKLFKSSDQLEKSIAVLPFKNLSNEVGNENFVDGLVRDLLNRISVIEELKVISSTSSEMYREKGAKSVSEIANELGVSYILEGSVQRYGDKARITVRLIDAINDDQIWADNYDREIVDVFKTQSDIVMKIVSELNTILTSAQREYIQENKTNNVKAFELYQLGRFYWNKRTGDGYNASIEYFEQAIEEDPSYGLAYAGLADTYNLMALQGWIDKQDGRDKAVELALKALKLDENLPEAYTVLGSIYDYVDWDWENAEKVLKHSLELNPNYATAHHYYSQHLHITGLHKDARKHIDKALELNPLSFVIRYVNGAEMYYNDGYFEKALKEINICNELYENHPWISPIEFKIYWQLGEEKKAYEELKKIFKRQSTYNLVTADSIYNISGLKAVLEWKIGIDLMDRESEMNLKDYNIAITYGMIGEDEKAMEWLEKAYASHKISPTMSFSIEFKNLHSNPRYIAISNKMGLGE